ncbi:MAG TPA: ROK family protein [Armatimonadota bacterium]|nr:ROK family protein [Armatimonadota bacterium]
MSRTEPYALGIDLGGTNIKFVIVEEDGTIRERIQRETGDRPEITVGADATDVDPAEAGVQSRWAGAIQNETRAIQERCGPAAWMGLAAPGLAARDARSIAFMPGRLPGLEGLDWSRFLEAPAAVPVLNDTHAALMGEAWLGAAAGVQDAILLTLGTGVGGGILSDGRLIRGHIGRAGHLGHTSLDPRGAPDICGAPGSLEDAIGDCTLPRRAAGRYTSTKEMVEAYRQGDAFAAYVWLQSVYDLACAVASFINILDPEVVVLGGGIARAGEDLFEPLKQFLSDIEWQPGGHQAKIVPATLGEYAGALGAARYAMLFDHPTMSVK